MEIEYSPTEVPWRVEHDDEDYMSPNAGGCWVCQRGNAEGFDTEFDTYYHPGCLERLGADSIMEYEDPDFESPYHLLSPDTENFSDLYLVDKRGMGRPPVETITPFYLEEWVQGEWEPKKETHIIEYEVEPLVERLTSLSDEVPSLKDALQAGFLLGWLLRDTANGELPDGFDYCVRCGDPTDASIVEYGVEIHLCGGCRR